MGGLEKWRRDIGSTLQHHEDLEQVRKSIIKRKYILNKKETHINFNGTFSSCKNCPKTFLARIKSATCRESSTTKQKFIVAVCPVHQTVKCSKVKNGCDKPSASCTTRHVRDRNGLRKLILTWGMSSKTSWVTRHNCTMVSGGGSRELIWESVRCLAKARRGTRRWVRRPGQCIHCFWYREVLCEADWERKGVVP